MSAPDAAQAHRVVGEERRRADRGDASLSQRESDADRERLLNSFVGRRQRRRWTWRGSTPHDLVDLGRQREQRAIAERRRRRAIRDRHSSKADARGARGRDPANHRSPRRRRARTPTRRHGARSSTADALRARPTPRRARGPPAPSATPGVESIGVTRRSVRHPIRAASSNAIRTPFGPVE